MSIHVHEAHAKRVTQVRKTRLTVLLGDGDGLRLVLDWRGANALKPCFKHANIVSKGSGIADSSQGEFVDICCSDHSVMRKVGPQYLAEVQDLLQAARESYEAGNMRKGRLDKMLQSSGFHFNENGMCACKELRKYIHFAEVATYDWVHSALQDGIVNVEMFAFVTLSALFAVTHAAFV